MSWLSKAIGKDKKVEKQKVAAKAAAVTAAADPWSAGNATTALQNAATTAKGYGDEANADYYNRLKGFNPEASVRNYAHAAYDETSANLRKQLSDLAGGAVGAGRINTGYFDEDQGEVVNRNLADYNSKVAGAAYSATGMQQQNTRDIGQFGSDQSGTYLSALQARRQEQADAAANDAAKKAKKKKGIGSAIGGVIGGIGGFFAGDPVGGATLGAGIGGSF